MDALLLADRWLLAGVFILAGITKVLHPTAFRLAVGEYRMLPPSTLGGVAGAVSVFEIAIGLLLALGVVPILAGAFAATALAVFAVAVSWNLLRGREFDCGCGVGGDTKISWRLVVRNVVLAGLASAVAWGPATALAILPVSAHQTHGSDSTLLAVPLIVMLSVCAARAWAHGKRALQIGVAHVGDPRLWSKTRITEGR